MYIAEIGGIYHNDLFMRIDRTPVCKPVHLPRVILCLFLEIFRWNLNSIEIDDVTSTINKSRTGEQK